jgi:hypothetical protein
MDTPERKPELRERSCATQTRERELRSWQKNIIAPIDPASQV